MCLSSFVPAPLLEKKKMYSGSCVSCFFYIPSNMILQIYTLCFMC